MNIKKADASDMMFVFESLKLLLDKKLYEFNEFEIYFHTCLKNPATDFWIALVDGSPIGLITANRFSMPRYLGFGVEFEEVTVSRPYQGKGYGTVFMQAVRDEYRKEPSCRKVIIKSNDLKGSCRLYEEVFSKTDFIVFQTFLNRI